MPANELSNFFGWVADQKGRIFLSALGAFFVLFVSNVVVARSSANLIGIRANSLATATGAAGAASMITLLYILSAKIPGSKD
jgi:hypothetical protein